MANKYGINPGEKTNRIFAVYNNANVKLRGGFKTLLSAEEYVAGIAPASLHIEEMGEGSKFTLNGVLWGYILVEEIEDDSTADAAGGR